MKIASCRPSSLTTLSLLGLLFLCASSSSSNSNRFLVFADEETGTACITASDCNDSDNNGGTYCASDGRCTSIGGCAVVDDCFDLANSPFPIAACMGTMECEDEMCGMNCSGGTDALRDDDIGDECRSSADCDDYCASNDVCLGSGMCTVVEDCGNMDNEYPLIECIGTLDCVEGGCSKTCGGEDNSGNNGLGLNGDDGDDDETTISCVTSADCDSDGDDYCASNDVCLEPRMCTTVEDCGNVDNVYSLIQCVGILDCVEGECSKMCDGEDSSEDETTSCATSDDCAGDGEEFCASNDVCLESGMCTVVEDCNNMFNIFPIVLCIGTMECEEGMCAMDCDTGGATDDNVTSDVDEVTDCVTSDDCDGIAEYCSSLGACLSIGECDMNMDCFNEDNAPFPVAFCMGRLECQEGTCDMNCGVQEDPVPGSNTTTNDNTNLTIISVDSCTNTTDCDADTEYCAQGTCTKKGMCISDSDCMNPNHIFADVMCIGYQYCDYDEEDAVDGFCARKCGVQCKDRSKMAEDCTVSECDSDSDDILCPGAVSCRPDSCNQCKAIYYDASGSVITECNPDEAAAGTNVSSPTAEGSDTTAVAVDAPSTSCTSDADCISASTARMADRDGMYCAQGTCMDMGGCLSDVDCLNPVNMFDDKRCAGYLTCDSSGMCDRICGEMCKNGSRSAMDCPVDPCDAELCPGAVSCQATSCDEVCDVVYFDAAGEVLTNCDDDESVDDGAVDDGTSIANGNSSSSETEKEADAEPTVTLMNNDSGGAFQTMILSASAIFVTSLFLTV